MEDSEMNILDEKEVRARLSRGLESSEIAMDLGLPLREVEKIAEEVEKSIQGAQNFLDEGRR